MPIVLITESLLFRSTVCDGRILRDRMLSGFSVRMSATGKVHSLPITPLMAEVFEKATLDYAGQRCFLSALNACNQAAKRPGYLRGGHCSAVNCLFHE